MKKFLEHNWIKLGVLSTILLLGVLGGAGYFALKQYQTEQAMSATLQAEQEAEKVAQDQLRDQQLKDLTEQVTTLKNKPAQIKTVINTITNTAIVQGQYDNIGSNEISYLFSGVVRVSCLSSSGSGFLYKVGSKNYLITNAHVVKTPYASGTCSVVPYDSGNQATGLYILRRSESLAWNKNTDIAIFAIYLDPSIIDGSVNLGKIVNVEDLNYGLSALPVCAPENDIGAPVVVIGFPAFSKQTVQIQGVSYGVQQTMSVTMGTISGHDTSVRKPLGYLPYSNYQVTAKIDSGNSGGVALSRSKNGKICLLGVPTWLSIGNYDTIGIVQDFNNVMYTQ